MAVTLLLGATQLNKDSTSQPPCCQSVSMILPASQPEYASRRLASKVWAFCVHVVCPLPGAAAFCSRSGASVKPLPWGRWESDSEH